LNVDTGRDILPGSGVPATAPISGRSLQKLLCVPFFCDSFCVSVQVPIVCQSNRSREILNNHEHSEKEQADQASVACGTLR
jgi:hypothetical protein